MNSSEPSIKAVGALCDERNVGVSRLQGGLGVLPVTGCVDILDHEELGQPPRRISRLWAHHQGRYLVDVETGGISEDEQQHDGHDDEHRQCSLVPDDLAELFANHGQHKVSNSCCWYVEARRSCQVPMQ
jgi:hypothetical protein